MGIYVKLCGEFKLDIENENRITTKKYTIDNVSLNIAS